MKMNHICLLEFLEMGDVVTSVGDIYGEEVLPLQTQMNEQTKTLPVEGELISSHHHSGMHPVILQSFHQSVSSNSCSSCSLAGIYYKDIHIIISR